MEDIKRDVSCTWQDEKQCRECVNRGALNCRWKAADLFVFFALVMPGMLGALAGTLIIWLTQDAWWPMAAYILSFPVILGIAETRFLCSHCPYYAREGIMLRCLANHGLLKIWRYHPEPMNRLEKGLMIALAIVFALIPLSILGYNIAYFAQNAASSGYAGLAAAISLAAVTAMSLVALAAVMVRHVCSSCVNFSCPFNMVGKERIDAYLLRNPVMRHAWEQKGYKIADERLASDIPE